MRQVIMVALILLLAASTQPQRQVEFPKDGYGVLEYCGPVIALLESPSSKIGSGDILTMKQGWCAGHLQTMREMIIFWQIQVVKTVAVLGGEQNPSAEELKGM